MPNYIGKAVCRHCGLDRTPEGHDGCLGRLEGVQSACCGHGVKVDGRWVGYVLFEDGRALYEDEAIEWMEANRKVDA